MSQPAAQIHPTAIVDEGAVIGGGTKVWHWTHVCQNAQIGENCSLGQNVFIAAHAKIGHNVKIQNNVSVYDGVVLEDDVFCGPSMVFTNVYNPRSAVVRKGEYKNTLVRKGVTFGANCTVVCGIEVGQYAFIGAGAVVKSSVSDYALLAGVPARQIGWMSRFGERIPVKFGESGQYRCPYTGDEYSVTKDNCELLTG